MGSATARLGRVARRFALAATALILTGCAARYFQDAGPPPAEAPRFALEQWPHRSYWTGIIFNGEKIGFSRTEIAPAGVPGEFELSSEAVIALRFLGIEKSIRLRSRDRVASDLTLRSFDYDYHIDGSDLRLTGRVEGAALRVTIVAGGQPDEQSHALDEPIYPAAAIAFMTGA
jgi:hypothetical protein